MKKNEFWLGVFQVLAAASLWGMAGTFAKFLFNNKIVPFDLAQARITFAFIILLIYLLIKNNKLLFIEKKDLGYMIIFGIGGLALAQVTLLKTISLSNVATAVFLEYLAPAFILVYGLITKEEKISKIKVLALIIALSGGFLIMFGNRTETGLTGSSLAWGIMAAVTFAFYSVYGKKGLLKYNVWTLLTWGFGFGAFAWLFYQPPWILLYRYDLVVWLQFLYFTVMATIFPFGLYFNGLKRLSAFRSGLISSFEPVVGALTAYILLEERLNLTQGMGSFLVLSGVLLIQLGNKERQEDLIVDIEHKGITHNLLK